MKKIFLKIIYVSLSLLFLSACSAQVNQVVPDVVEMEMGLIQPVVEEAVAEDGIKASESEGVGDNILVESQASQPEGIPSVPLFRFDEESGNFYKGEEIIFTRVDVEDIFKPILTQRESSLDSDMDYFKVKKLTSSPNRKYVALEFSLFVVGYEPVYNHTVIFNTVSRTFGKIKGIQWPNSYTLDFSGSADTESYNDTYFRGWSPNSNYFIIFYNFFECEGQYKVYDTNTMTVLKNLPWDGCEIEVRGWSEDELSLMIFNTRMNSLLEFNFFSEEKTK